MYHQFKIQLFYVLPTHCIYVFCVDLRTNSHYSLYNINCLVFITQMQYVYCAVRTGCLCIIHVSFCLQKLRRPKQKPPFKELNAVIVTL